MTSHRSDDSSRGRWICLSLGALALCLSNGVTANVAAAWIAPVLLLRFAATSRPLAGYGVLAVVVAIASYVTMRGVIPVSQAEFLVTCAISGVLGALPYLGHRLLTPHLVSPFVPQPASRLVSRLAPRFAPRLASLLASLAGTLVFSSASVALLYLLSAGSPFGTWGADGYIQADFSLLTQFASVAGVWGVTFVLFWFASATQGLIPPRMPHAWPAFAAFAAVFALVLGYGALRMARAPAPSTEVGVAALATPPGLPDRFFEGCASRDDRICRDAGAQKRMDALFARAAAAARSGAMLVVWPEAGVQYDAPLEEEFVSRARAFSREHKVYLVAGAARVPAMRETPMENKAMVFTPSGELAFEYHKAIPVPGEPIAAGDGEIKTIATPFGRLGVIICFDADFPMLVRQAKRRGVDVLAIPANDWRAITPLHGQMVRFRAIENGFSIVRAASNGLSLVADSTGAVLAEVDSFATPGGVASARLPVRTRDTAYARIGDFFAVACVLLFAALALAVSIARFAGRKVRPGATS